MAPAGNGRILFRRNDEVSVLKRELILMQKGARETAAREAELVKEAKELPLKKRQLVVVGQEREMAKRDMMEQLAQAKQKVLRLQAEFEGLETAERETFNRVTDLKGKIRVALRIRRPLHGEACADCIKGLALSESGIEVEGRTVPGKFFRLWGPCDDQDIIFEDIQDLIKSALNGYNVSVICYGETGSGKTYTMIGGNETDSGLLPRAVSFILKQRELLSSNGWQYALSVNCYEIYNEQFIDLLDMKAVQIPRFTDGILDNSCFRTETIGTTEEVMFLMRGIQHLRTSGSTELNRSSSRSHCIFRISIDGVSIGRGSYRSSVLTFVDLAGSERVEKSLSSGLRLKEAKCINSSLLCLRNVIRGHLHREQVVRYRDSKLTMALSSSLGAASSKTFLIVALSPSAASSAETLRSIRFAADACATSIGPARALR